ncbi:hypothetical protein MMC26_006721 [Xylographa opegraphella]|nr:hypothetical protein [Xylographa opegraphella]
MSSNLDLLICTACGTQFGVDRDSKKAACRICDSALCIQDPRQFVPPTGQSFTTLKEMREGAFENKWQQDEIDHRVHSVWTEPKFGIGERAILLQTEHGNVLWDLIAFLDEATIEKIKSLGGIKAIVISHPHYYTTYVEWAQAFHCPVYTSFEDAEWLDRQDTLDVERRLIRGFTETILDGVTAIKTGGHFDGSLVLHWERQLFIADSLLTVQSAYYHVDRLPGTTSYAFMWSIPNFIPLPPQKVMQIWRAVRPFEFTSTHGAFVDTDVRGGDVKRRVLESAKIQVRAEGWERCEILNEE